MNVGELIESLGQFPKDAFISLVNYNGNEKDYGEIEMVEGFHKESNMVSIRVKPEVGYC